MTSLTSRRRGRAGASRCTARPRRARGTRPGRRARPAPRQSLEEIASAGHLDLRDRAGGERAEVDGVVARPGDADEVREVEQLVGPVPAEDLRERVRAGDEEQLGVAVRGVQVPQGVDRVGAARPVDVGAADREARVGRRRDDGHEVAVLGGADPPVVLLVRVARRHEHDLVEGEPGRDLAGGRQVPVVDGVERPAHDPDPPAHVTQRSAPTAPVGRPRLRSAAAAGRRPRAGRRCGTRPSR